MKDSIQKILIDHLFVNDTVKPLNEYEKLKEEFDKLKKEKEEELETLKSIYKAKIDNLSEIIVELKKKVVYPDLPSNSEEKIFTDIEGRVKSLLAEKNELQEQLNAILNMSVACGEKHKIKSSGNSVYFCLGKRRGCLNNLFSCPRVRKPELMNVDMSDSGGFFIIGRSTKI